MKNKRKLGQAIIEYVLLLIIPVLLISVLPNLNKTVELTLNTVGVDLMEEEGQTPDTPDPVCNDEDICSPKILYPPVANMELPDNKDCNEKGVYRKGASIRIQDLSYDTDPDNSGSIDHLEWTVEKKDPSGAVVEECSTTTRHETLKLSRKFGGSSDSTGLTIDMNGYGGVTDYALCVRDPGTFTVTLKAFDNDGLLSSNMAEKTFEIRDLKPSIRLEVNVADSGTTINGSAMQNIYSQSLSNTCAFDPKLEKGVNQSPEIDSNTTDNFTYDGVTYYYTEVCPKDTSIGRSGQVTFKLVENEKDNQNKAFLTDPDFTATDYGKEDDPEAIPEGAENSLYGYKRHGFTYQSRFIQSSVLDPTIKNAITTNNSQMITFKDGATEYTKEFENPGTYMFDAQVYDENLISSQTYGVQNKDVYKPDVGVAIKVLSPNDANYEKKCGSKIPETITCPKPIYVLGITKTVQGSNEKFGPVYFTIGSVGSIDQKELKNIKDENEKEIEIITDINTGINQLKEKLQMDVVAVNHKTKAGIKIPVFRPTTNEHLDIKGLTYFPKNEGTSDVECGAGGASRYWATSNGWNNNFDFNNILIGKPNAIWAKGEDPVNDWFEIRRPYDESATDDLYYNIANVTSITPGMSLKIGDEIIEHVELIYGQARSSAAEMDVKTLGTDIIASAFNGQISTDKIKNEKNQSIVEPLGTQSDMVRSSYYSTQYDKNIFYNKSYFRTNGQLIAIAPKLQSCPLHDQRPVPVFSYITTTDTIETLTSETNGVSNVNGSEITWSIDTKNPPKGLSCTTEGCTVSITANDSVCGTNTKNCTIKAIRWKFSPYTHEPYQGSDGIEGALEKATPINVTSNLNRYFPLTNKVSGENSTMPYPKYESWFYPLAKKFTPINETTTVSDGYDKFYSSLPTNNNLKGSYIYYGPYGSTEEMATEKGTNRAEVPTFDFVKRTGNMSIAELRQTGTVAPNANEIFTSTDNPNIPEEKYTSTTGMFLEAGSSYTYTIEIVDSQGCATSKTLTINISDSSKEPVAFCNFMEKTVPAEDIINYKYYEGLLVQARNDTGANEIVSNGDSLEIPDESYKFYVSPLLQFTPKNNAMSDNTSYVSRNSYVLGVGTDGGSSFNYNLNTILPKPLELTSTDFDPRVGQIGTNDTLNGILNLKNSRLYDGADIAESDAIFADPNSHTTVTWKLYKAYMGITGKDGKKGVDRKDYNTEEEYDAAVDAYFEERKTYYAELGDDNLSGIKMFKYDEEPVATVITNSLDDAPQFNKSLFEAGYYIVEATLSYQKDGETLTSKPTECNLRVTAPTLDFKCPWGETFEELRGNALELRENLIGPVTPSDDLMSVLKEDEYNGKYNYFNENRNSHITDVQITTNLSNDYNELDTFENDDKNNYSKVKLIDFDADKLNTQWNNLKKYGYYHHDDYYSICDESNKDRCDFDRVDPLEQIYQNSRVNLEGIQYTDAQIESYYNAVKNTPTINPLTLTVDGKTETMSLQGWILRERLTRDNITLDFVPLYMQSASKYMSDNEYELLNTEMTPNQESALDYFLIVISKDGLFTDMENIRPYKILIANKLKYSSAESFNFLDLQPPYVDRFNWGTTSDKETWWVKYTGTKRTSGVVEKTATAMENSVRKGDINYSEAFGKISNSYYSTYITTPFFGKYEAAKRFQDLNYSFLQKNPNNLVNYKTLNNTTGNIYEDRVLNRNSYKNYFINPLSVTLNNIGTVDDKISNLNMNFSVWTNMSDITSGVQFNSLPWSLSANSDFLQAKNHNPTSGETLLDYSYLNNITWDFGAKLGYYDIEKNKKYKESAITYVRVNVANKNQQLKSYTDTNKTVYNNYSKLCPVMVSFARVEDLQRASCNIGYTNPEPGNTTVIGVDSTNGSFIDAAGNVLNWEYLNNNYKYVKKSDIYKVPTTRVYAPNNGSREWNMGDLHLNIKNEKEFLTLNKNTNLYKAKYKFYIKTDTGPQYIQNGSFDIIYDIKGKTQAKGSLLDDKEIAELANNAYQQFENNYYDGTGHPKIASDFVSTLGGSDAPDDTYEFDYMDIGYTVEYYSSDTDMMKGEEATRQCSFFAAYEKQKDSNKSKYVLEIGSWWYRVQYPQSYKNKHWDRTYDLDIAQPRYTNMVSLATPNQMCKWTSVDYGAVSAADGTPYYTAPSERKFGGTMAPTDPNYNGGCITAGTTTPYKISDDSPTKKQLAGVSERQAKSLGLVTEYDLGSSVGFYSVALYVTPGPHATSKGAIQNQCFYFAGGDKQTKIGKYIPATTIVSGAAISEDPNQYWCGKATMYVKTNDANSVPGLTGKQVMEIIFKDNGNTYASQQTANYDFFRAVKEQIDNCYEKAGTAQCRNFVPRLEN